MCVLSLHLRVCVSVNRCDVMGEVCDTLFVYVCCDILVHDCDGGSF